MTQVQVEKVEALEAVPPSPPPMQLEMLLLELGRMDLVVVEERRLRRDQAVQRLLQGEDQEPMGLSQSVTAS
jgi:hypothetical protein